MCIFGNAGQISHGEFFVTLSRLQAGKTKTKVTRHHFSFCSSIIIS